jgi:hypothetical protein
MILLKNNLLRHLHSRVQNVPWSEGGRALVDIFNLNHKILSSSEYFFLKNNIAEVKREFLVAGCNYICKTSRTNFANLIMSLKA